MIHKSLSTKRPRCGSWLVNGLDGVDEGSKAEPQREDENAGDDARMMSRRTEGPRVKGLVAGRCDWISSDSQTAQRPQTAMTEASTTNVSGSGDERRRPAEPEENYRDRRGEERRIGIGLAAADDSLHDEDQADAGHRPDRPPRLLRVAVPSRRESP